MEKQFVVINTTAGASDATMQNRNLQLKNCPVINFLDIVSVGDGWLPSLVETLDTATVSFTAAANTSYSLQLSQYSAYLQKNVMDVVRYQSDATGTNTVIRDGMIDYINRRTTAGQWQLTATLASTTSFTVVAVAGNPKFTAVALSNTTVVQGIAVVAPNGTPGTALKVNSIAPNGTPATALAGTSTVTVTTLAAHGLTTGMIVDITAATGFTFVRNGVSSSEQIRQAQITVTAATTFTLDGVTGIGTNTGTIVINPFSGLNVIVTTNAAHGLVVGQSVNITTATGFTFTKNGVSTVASISNAVIASVPSTTTFTLEGVTGSGTNSGTIVITPLAQPVRASSADLIARGASSSDVVSGQRYSMLYIEYYNRGNDVVGGMNKGHNSLWFCVQEGISNFQVLKTTVQNHLAALIGNISNPEIAAVNG